MRACTYCGRENEESAIQCRECGTQMQPTQDLRTQPSPTLKAWLLHPAHLAWLAAGITLVQALVRLSMTPYHPSLGEGDVDRLSAAFYLWKSAAVSTALVALGLYLRSRRKVQHVA